MPMTKFNPETTTNGKRTKDISYIHLIKNNVTETPSTDRMKHYPRYWTLKVNTGHLPTTYGIDSSRNTSLPCDNIFFLFFQ